MSLEKVAIGTGVAVLVAGGGYGISTLLNGGMPEYSARQKGSSADKYVDDYPDYFVDASSNENDSWWSWVYKSRYLVGSDEKDSDGKTRPTPKRGFLAGITDGSSIKSVCSQVYGSQKAKIKKEDGTLSNDEYSEADVWRYCTAVNKKPILINLAETELKNNKKEKEGYDDTTYGNTNKENLVAISPEDNKYFWTEQQRLFFGEKSKRSGKHAQHKTFQDLWTSKTGRVKETCHSVYISTKAESTDDADLKKDLFKFCSLKGAE
ncbi:hypothetical protein MHSWG343_04980 [Candidatus Mycoplasma haematohominis]|uniref:Uncharacterized protein n=1 Tax=Candidatus Mycoplasma haematohominis TaxID=1494318 RepID=A0A478FPY1_9MOLU|nr:hypothetical protein MHSWG343_04980 [Candidatus Mycoplasma haemohominis]